MNVQTREHVFRTFVIHLLVHIRQKNKLALEIVAKIDYSPINQNFDLNKSRQNSIIA